MTTMAKQISAKRDSAGEVPGSGEAAEQPARVLPDLSNRATESDMQRAFAIKRSTERDYEAFGAKQRSEKTAAKAVRDKALSDIADMMKSRGITKPIFQELYELYNRTEAEQKAEMQAKLWAIRAIGLPVGKQLGFFEEEFDNADEALRRCRQQGYDAFVDKKPDSSNPYQPSSREGQNWLEGHNAAGADSLKPN